MHLATHTHNQPTLYSQCRLFVPFTHCTLQSAVLELLTKSQVVIAMEPMWLHIPILYHLSDCSVQRANRTRRPGTTVHMHSRTHARSYTRTVEHTHSRTHAQSYTRMVVHTHSRTHARSYTRTVVHTHSMLAFSSHQTNEPVHSLAAFSCLLQCWN